MHTPSRDIIPELLNPPHLHILADGCLPPQPRPSGAARAGQSCSPAVLQSCWTPISIRPRGELLLLADTVVPGAMGQTMSFTRSAARIRDQLCGRTSPTRPCLPNEPTCPACSADQPIISTRRYAQKPLPYFVVSTRGLIPHDGIPEHIYLLGIAWPSSSRLPATKHPSRGAPEDIPASQHRKNCSHMGTKYKGGPRLWAQGTRRALATHLCQRQVRLHQSMYLYMQKRRGGHRKKIESCDPTRPARQWVR